MALSPRRPFSAFSAFLVGLVLVLVYSSVGATTMLGLGLFSLWLWFIITFIALTVIAFLKALVDWYFD